MIDLSIVIPSFETPALLERALASIEAATKDGLAARAEVIVVDDGSRDDSVARAARSPLAPRIVAGASNRGFAAAVNRGLRIARGRVVLLLNADAEVDAALLDGALARFDADPRLGVLGPALVGVDGRPQRSVHRAPRVFAPVCSRATAVGSTVSDRDATPAETDRSVEALRGAVLFVRRALVEALGGLDEGYAFFLEDTDLCLRARAAGARVVFAPGLRARHRLGASSKARVPAATRIEYHRSLYRFLARHRGPAAARLVFLGRTLRNAAAWPLHLLHAAVSPRGRARLAERSALLLWHLRGAPTEPTLAAALAARPPGAVAGAEGAADA